MKTTLAVLLAGAFVAAALWARRGWAQFRADEIAMDAAMEARLQREDREYPNWGESEHR